MKALQFSSTTRAVLIGVDKFDDSKLRNLKSPASSVNALFTALSNKEGCAVPVANLYLAGSGNGIVSKNDIVTSLEQAIQDGSSDDILIVFYAGHGIIQHENFYLCPTEGVLEGIKSCLSSNEVSDLLVKSPFRGVLFIIDSCEGSGFAERNPAFFQSLGSADFRILLSSSRDGEQSWEFPDIQGTIFTKLLIAAISGERPIGVEPGQIYFTDLLTYLRDGIDEALKIRHNVERYSQQPVFCGLYSQDPLIFVHRKLTLDQVEVRRKRFSPLYVRRMIQRTLIAVAATIGIVLGGLYTYLDKSAYLTRINEHIVIMQGHPKITGFGFPKLIWETDLPPSGMSLFEGREVYRLPGRALGALPDFFVENLKSPYRELELLRRERRDEALNGLRSFLSSEKGLNSLLAGAATELFATLCQKSDLDLLISLTQIARIDVRIGAYVGILKIDPQRAYELLLSGSAPLKNRDFVRRLLPKLDINVEGRTEILLGELISEGSIGTSLGPIFETALRLGVKLSDEVIWEAILDSPMLYDRSPAIYLSALGQEEKWVLANAEQFQRVLSNVDEFDAVRAIFFLSLLQSNPLEINFAAVVDTDGTSYDARFIAGTAALAALRHGQLTIDKLSIDILDDELFIDNLAQSYVIPPDLSLEILERLDPYEEGLGTAAHKLHSISGFLDERAIPALEAALNYEDPNDISGPFHAFAVRELCRVKKDFLPTDFLNRESNEVVREAVLCLAERDLEAGKTEAFRIMREYDDDLGRALLLALPLEPNDIRDLRKLVAENSSLSKTAASILAVVGEEAEVLSLFRSKHFAIRDAVTEYVGANTNYLTLEKALKGDILPYPNGMRTRLEVTRKWRNRIDEAFSIENDAISIWKIETVAGFQNLSKGAEIYFQAVAALKLARTEQ